MRLMAALLSMEPPQAYAKQPRWGILAVHIQGSADKPPCENRRTGKGLALAHAHFGDDRI